MRFGRSSVPISNITEGVIWQQLLIFFFPILFGTFFQQLYNTADAIIVGQYVSTNALASVGGSASVIINLLVNLLVGISSGATIVVAQQCGARNLAEVHTTVHTSFALAIVGGAVMMVIGLVVSPWALTAMDTPAALLADSIIYLRVFFIGMIPSFIYNIGSGILRAIGDSRRPLYFLIVACLVNIALDLLFVLVFGLGVLGVALATVVSQFVAGGLVVVSLLRAVYPCQLVPKELRFTSQALKRVLRVGLPAGIQADMYTISNILVQSCINSFGEGTIAAWTAFGKIDAFFWMVMGAFGIAVMTFVGQNFGAQKYDRIRKSVRVCLSMSLGTAIVCSLLLCLFGRTFLSMFTRDTAVLNTGVTMILHMVPFYITYICVEILAGAIRGTGNSLAPMLMICFGVCVVRILYVSIAMPLDWRIETLLFGFPFTWSISSLLFVVYYLHGGWLRKQIAKAGFAPEVRTPKKQKQA